MLTRIDLTGPDALNFIQGQLTQNVHATSGTHSPLAAWCDPKGRVLAVMRLVQIADGIALVLPASIAATVADGLSRYRLRAKVSIAPDPPGWAACAIANATDRERQAERGLLPEPVRDASRVAGDVTAVSIGDDGSVVELYGTAETLAALDLSAPLQDAAWHAARIAAGIVDIVPATSGRYTPHMLNLDTLGAISFDKGCYTGQEIVARTQHLGRSRRRLAIYRASSAPAIAAEVTHEGKPVGEIVDAAGADALVLLPLDLHGKPLQVADAALTPAN